MAGRKAGIAPNGKSHHYSDMARSGETSSTGDKAAHGKATMRGGARRYFKIPPVIDHQGGSFLADRLRLLGALLMPLHWPRFLLVSLFLLAAVVTAIIFDIREGQEVPLKSEVPSLCKGIPLDFSACL